MKVWSGIMILQQKKTFPTVIWLYFGKLADFLYGHSALGCFQCDTVPLFHCSTLRLDATVTLYAGMPPALSRAPLTIPWWPISLWLDIFKLYNLSIFQMRSFKCFPDVDLWSCCSSLDSFNMFSATGDGWRLQQNLRAPTTTQKYKHKHKYKYKK